MHNWENVCAEADLVPGSGIAALVKGEQVAIFYLPEQTPALHAIGNHDPLGGANVLSRGIVGDLNGERVVASPLYKHHFSLTTGACLEEDGVSVPVWEVKLDNGRVHVRPAGEAPELHQTGT